MNFVLRVFIITLSSIDWRAENSHPNGTGTLIQTLVASETLRKSTRFSVDSLGPSYHHASLLLVSPVVTLAEAAEYPLEDFSHDPEHGDYYYYFHAAIYFYLIIYLLKYVTTQLNNYIITYLYIFGL